MSNLGRNMGTKKACDGFSWPQGVQVHDGRMYLHGKLAIPTELQKSLVREHHSFGGHVGFERLWKHMDGRYVWAYEGPAKAFAKAVQKECTICQACDPPVSLKCKIRPTPVPPHVMSHVALDLFKMPPVEHDGLMYDTLVVCVDLHSGWVVAIPTLQKGLTGAKLARMMLNTQWRPFCIPSVVTGDI